MFAPPPPARESVEVEQTDAVFTDKMSILLIAVAAIWKYCIDERHTKVDTDIAGCQQFLRILPSIFLK